MQVLDIGGGLGGAARFLASDYDCEVTVLDLTGEYCRIGAMLTERTGLSDRVEFKVGDALEMPFPDRSFDLVWTQHSSMNIADKARLYAQARRVLRPGGRLALHEIMAGPVQPGYFPAPWASQTETSFLLPPSEVRAIILGVGFREVVWRDATAGALKWFDQRPASANMPPLGLHLLLGDLFLPAFANQVRNLREDRITVVEAVFECD